MAICVAACSLAVIGVRRGYKYVADGQTLAQPFPDKISVLLELWTSSCLVCSATFTANGKADQTDSE